MQAADTLLGQVAVAPHLLEGEGGDHVAPQVAVQAVDLDAHLFGGARGARQTEEQEDGEEGARPAHAFTPRVISPATTPSIFPSAASFWIFSGVGAAAPASSSGTCIAPSSAGARCLRCRRE